MCIVACSIVVYIIVRLRYVYSSMSYCSIYYCRVAPIHLLVVTIFKIINTSEYTGYTQTHTLKISIELFIGKVSMSNCKIILNFSMKRSDLFDKRVIVKVWANRYEVEWVTILCQHIFYGQCPEGIGCHNVKMSVYMSLCLYVMSHFRSLWLVKRGNVTSSRRSLRWMSMTNAT